MKNTSYLHQAKTNKKDEFYTSYKDIQIEVDNYDLHGMVVYAPCDDYRASNFVKYFVDNYTTLGLQGFVATNIDNGNGAFKYEYDGTTTTITPIENGDFRCQDNSFADIIITNPPFSLFRDFVKWIGDKKFLVLGNQNALNYSEIFPMVMENKITWGVTTTGANKLFEVDSTYPLEGSFSYENGGKKYIRVTGTRWYTNMPILKKTFTPTKHFDSTYQVFDGTDIINCDSYKDIPCDYNGLIGVPTSYYYYHNPKLYKLVGELKTGKDNQYDLGKPLINGKSKFIRLVIQKR